MGKLVVLGLSGGVDSAVAAYLLKKQGYDVTGLYLDIGTPDGEKDALSVGEAVGIPVRVRDIRGELEEKVCAPFACAYLKGETPNPCVMCNPTVKFPAILSLADELGAEYIATGHYARTEHGAQPRLLRAVPGNDQSYMLCRLTQRQVSRLILPLGGYEKRQVRDIALEAALPVADKPDSMEICFVPDGDYAAFIERRGDAPAEGEFVDAQGNVLGRHRGIHHYTLGQRRGLGISAGRRVFVSAICRETNRVVLSDGDDLAADGIAVADMNWITKRPDGPFPATVKVRHSRTETPATVTPKGGGITVLFDSPVRAPTPGQAAAVYVGDVVVGGGVITG